jgi:hypothetical protein
LGDRRVVSSCGVDHEHLVIRVRAVVEQFEPSIDVIKVKDRALYCTVVGLEGVWVAIVCFNQERRFGLAREVVENRHCEERLADATLAATD